MCSVLNILFVAGCPVFAEMFQSGMKEASTDEIEIGDFDNESIQGMLDYIYFRTLPSMNQNPVDGFCIAHKLKLPELGTRQAEGAEAVAEEPLKTRFSKFLDIIKKVMTRLDKWWKTWTDMDYSKYAENVRYCCPLLYISW